MSHSAPNSTESPENEIKLRKSSEARDQSLVYRWTTKQSVREAAPAIAFLYHCPNGEKRDKVTANQLKAMGVRPGVPDLTLPVAKAPFNGLVIEMKTDIGTVSPEQKVWLQHYLSQNWRVEVCRSAAEAHVVLCDYFRIDPQQYPL